MPEVRPASLLWFQPHGRPECGVGTDRKWVDGGAAGTDVLSGEEHIVLRCSSRDASGFSDRHCHRAGTAVAFQGYVSCCTVTAANVKGVTPILIEKLALISPPVSGDRRLSILVLCTVVHFIVKRQTTLKTKRGKTKLSLTTTNKKKNLNDITMVWPDG